MGRAAPANVLASTGSGRNPELEMTSRFCLLAGKPALCFLAWTFLFAAGISNAAQKPGGRIAFIGAADQMIYTCTGDCAKPECITCPIKGMHVRRTPRVMPVSLVQMPYMPQEEPGEPEPEEPGEPEEPPEPQIRYGWPTFSPDAGKLAFSWVGHRDDGSGFGISVFDFSSHDTIDIFASRNERVDYIFWTHDAKSVSFLLNEPHGLSLILAQVREKAPVRLVLSGAPVYYDWDHEGGRLVVHTNHGEGVRTENVTLMNITANSQDVIRTLSHGRVPFKTPCWSPDGKHLAYVGNNNAESYLLVADSDGNDPKSMVSLPIGETSFVWSPDSRHIAYSTAEIGSDMVFSGIRVLDIKRGEIQRLTGDDVQAYYYSPDGRYLAYVAVPPELPYFVWNLVDLKSGKVRKLEKFLATPEESVSFHYFDQLALSHPIWSPDSREFIFTGVRIVGDPRPPLGLTPPLLWIVPVDGGKPLSAEGTASFAVFSPALSD